MPGYAQIPANLTIFSGRARKGKNPSLKEFQGLGEGEFARAEEFLKKVERSIRSPVRFYKFGIQAEWVFLVFPFSLTQNGYQGL